MTSAERRERSQDLDRLLTFIDAIVAIAITLLVLPLVDVAGEIHDGDHVWDKLGQHGGQFGAFLLSFAVIARLWLAQHRIVRGAVEADTHLAWALIGWSATIVFLPFPTSLLSATGDQPATKTLYIGTLLLSSAMLTLIAASVRRGWPEGIEGKPRVTDAAAVAVLLGIALLICLLVPSSSYYPLLVLTVPERLIGAAHLYRWWSRR